jgi:hypothetical protein
VDERRGRGVAVRRLDRLEAAHGLAERLHRSVGRASRILRHQRVRERRPHR